MSKLYAEPATVCRRGDGEENVGNLLRCAELALAFLPDPAANCPVQVFIGFTQLPASTFEMLLKYCRNLRSDTLPYYLASFFFVVSHKLLRCC